MHEPYALPDDLAGPFSVRDAAALGIGPERLRRQDLRRPYPGVRVRASLPPADTLRDQVREYSPRLRPGQFFSHETALALYGVPTPPWPHRTAIHVSAYRPAREPRTPGIVGHRLQHREPAWSDDLLGIPIESPVRAWRQAGMTWRLDDLVAAADHLLFASPVAIEDLRSEVETMGDPRGILRAALVLTRVGVRSPRESTLRLVLARGGLPEPEINWILRDEHGMPVAELDLAFPRWRVCPEYDGRVHELDGGQFARDVDRWDRIRREGWEHVRIMRHHMRGGGAEAVRRVRDALLRAGWRPPQ
ncbi:MAG: hypothetical protein DI573_10615 [Microbacterium sp.]|nr:MAG: hypothetical protein DI573_10615 [Microbacterium sp.]